MKRISFNPVKLMSELIFEFLGKPTKRPSEKRASDTEEIYKFNKEKVSGEFRRRRQNL